MFKAEGVWEMLREIDALPAENFAHIIAAGIREYERMTEKIILGKKHVEPPTIEFFVAIGRYGVADAGYAMSPTPAKPADFAIVDAIMNALKGGPHKPGTEEEIKDVTSGSLRTAAIALYGLDADKKPVLMIGHHPDFSYAKAAGSLLGILYMHMERQRQGGS